jgi:multidrug resistance protein, MATE family
VNNSSIEIGLPYLQRELRVILHLTVPLATSFLVSMVMGVTDTIMMGRVSSDALAAGGLAANVAFLLSVMAQGLISAVQPMVAQMRGAGDHAGFSRILSAGLLLGFLASLPIVLVLVKIDTLFGILNEPRQISVLALEYLTAFAWGVPASMLQCVLRFYLSALERTRVIMVVTIVSCLVNFGLNWVLIFGHFGFKALGLSGSGYATAITSWGMTACFALYLWGARLAPPNLFRNWTDVARGMRDVMRLGWPIAGIYLVEVGLFVISGLMIGWFGPIALTSHQICLNIATFTLMVPLAIGQAATVRIGYYVGAGALQRAQVVGFMAIGLGVGFMTLMAVIITSLMRPIFHLYLNALDPNVDAVLALGGRMIILAGIFQVFDGAQAVAASALRGLGDTQAALIIGIVGYWVIGMPLGAGLAFWLDFGPIGLWWGFTLGLVAVSVMLTLRFRHRIAHMLAVEQARPSSVALVDRVIN